MPEYRTLVGCLNGLVVGFGLLLPSVVLAAPKDKPARALEKEAMQTDYGASNFKKAEQKLKKALTQCGKSGCSDEVVGDLHRDLATVYIAGMKQGPKGKAELQRALQANPDLELDEDQATPELRKVFKQLGGHGPKPEQESVDEKPSKPKEAEEDCEPGADGCDKSAPTKEDSKSSADKSAKNWLSLHFEQDLLLYSSQDQVCASNATGSPEAANYSCFKGGARFGVSPGQDIAAGPGNKVSGGIGRGTSRILIGFDRLLGENVSVGLRLGYALFGRPAGKDKFLPFHAEIRANYWFGSAPFEGSGVRPYLSLSGGLAEVDGRVSVEYYDPARNKGTLDAWRKTGRGFAGLGFGLMLPFAGDNGIVPELRALKMFGASGTVFDVSLGYARGF